MRFVLTPLARFRGAGLVFLIIFCAAVSASAQVKKGFKKLKKNDFEAAEAIFEAALENESEAVAARWGLAQTLADTTNESKNFAKSQAHVAALRQLFEQKKLKTDERKQLEKDFGLSRKTLSALEKETTKAAWRALGDAPSLTELTFFAKNFPKKSGRVASDFQSKMAASLQNALAKSEDWGELQCLFTEHDSLQKLRPDAWKKAEWRLFDAFLKEKGNDRAADFFEENPKTSLAADAGAPFLPAVLASDDAAPALDFLLRSPESAFAPMVEKRVQTWASANSGGGLEAKISGLDERRRAAFADATDAAIFEKSGFSKKFEPALFAAWDSTIRRRAPGYRSLAAVKKMVNFHLERRESSLVRLRLAGYAPLFPADTAWFSSIERRVRVVLLPQKPHQPPGLLNSRAIEFSPTPTLLGDELFFCRVVRGRETIMRSTLANGAWTEPTEVRELASTKNQSPVSISADGNQMLFFDDGKVFTAQRGSDGKWKKTGAIRADLAQFDWVGYTMEVAGGQILLFEARPIGSKNDNSTTNIYMARREKSGAFGPPVLLPSPINFDGTAERSPFLHPDLETLYFSSNRAGGKGGLDVFMSKRLDDTWQKWSEPVSLGDSINTRLDDWCYKISTDGYSAMLSSIGEKGENDILQVGLPASARPEDVIVKILDVSDEKGRPLGDGDVVVKKAGTSEIVGRFPIRAGKSTLALPARTKTFDYHIDRKGIVPTTRTLDNSAEIDALGADREKFGRSTASVGGPLTVNSTDEKTELRVFFDFGKADLRPESMPDLELKADFILKYEVQKIRLEGWTDAIGSDENNRQLSQKRVEAVRAALVQLGVPTERIEAVGMGESSDFDNETEDGRQANRRVEMSFLE